MSFKKEDDMYPLIANFLETEQKFRGCKTVQNKIFFNILKGWKIDVAGIIREKNNYIIAVEAKNNVGPYSIMQAISQAEMYQKVSNESYIALPNEDIINLKNEAINDWNNILNLCRIKGIGIISVDDNGCNIINEALNFLKYDLNYRDILSQIEYETLTSFDGFKYEDLSYFHKQFPERRELVKKKLELFIESIKTEMLNHPREYYNIDPRNLNAELPNRGFSSNGCWFFISEINRKELAKQTHFTLYLNSEGISCCVNLETKLLTNFFIEKVRNLKIEFKKIMNSLKDKDFNVIVYEAIPNNRPYRSAWPWVKCIELNLKQFEKDDSYNLFLSLLENIKYPIIRFNATNLSIYDDRIHSFEAVKYVCDNVKKLQEIYGFCKMT